MDVVANTFLQGVSRIGQGLERSLGTEITATAKGVLRDGSPQARIDIAYQHRRGCEVIEHPLSETVLAACIFVIDEELDGERMRHETASHKGSVGSIG